MKSKSKKPLLSLNRFFAEIGLSYEQGLEEIRRGNIVTVKKARGKNSYIDRSEVVRWRINRNREALGLAPIQPATTPRELMVLEMCYLYGNPEDEKYYATDYERDFVAKKQEEEANAKEEVVEAEVENTDEEEKEEELETASQDVEVDDKETEEASVDETQNENEVEDSEANTSETEEASDKQDENSDTDEEDNSDTDTNESENE